MTTTTAVDLYIILSKSHHRALLRRLREICTAYGLERTGYRCKTYPKMPDKYEMSMALSPAPHLSLASWRAIYETLFRQTDTIILEDMESEAHVVLFYFPPYPTFESDEPEQYFVLMSIPRTCVSDWETAGVPYLTDWREAR